MLICINWQPQTTRKSTVEQVAPNSLRSGQSWLTLLNLHMSATSKST